jgi:TP901 family phage tail tape measure protein
MASVTATINVQINAANAAAQLTALQSKVAAMNKGMLAATAGGVMAQEKAIRRMGTILSGSGMFTTGIRNVHTELGRMHQEFDRGSTSLQNYRKNSRMWGQDHSNINRMAADRVRMLQSQYVALGKEMNGVQKAMQIKPDRMMREFGADAEYAHQRAMLFRRNLQMGSTALVNWGKNTQWAGRQMMVGMGIPIAIAAAGAVKAFNDIEKSSIAFKRVYGDATTSVAEKSQMLVKVQKTVGNEMMKYGIAMSDTLDVSAKAAATGARGADLIAATRETMRLATLGNMDYNKALEATIAMQTAFNINSKDMAKTTDFLNAVENQTILSMEDMALAVPRVAPVIKGLGGNVEELAIMMTALRQGGVSAEQGANALKSGLGSLLNPTGTAIEQFDQMGVNLKKIVETNKGDLIGTIQSLGKALDGLSKYDRQRALESLFGKYQYARMGALLKNINSKAVKETMRLAKAGNAELAKMSEQELGQISDSPMIKLRASIEELKAAAAPLGALFSDIAAKIVSFATPVVSFFANNDAAKWGLVVGAGLAALAGTLTMIIGVFANFAGSMVKAGMSVRTFFRFITGQRSLAYVTTDGLEASAAANSLATAAERAAGGMLAEAKAAQLLTSQLEALIAAQNGAAATSRRPGPGTGGVPVAPRPGGPSTPGGVAVPTGRMPAVSQSAAVAFESGYDRAHAARPVVYMPGDKPYDSARSHYENFYRGRNNGELVIPNTDHGRILQDMIAGKPVTGFNAEAFLMKSKLNNLMDNGGADANAIFRDASTLGGRTVAPYFENLARAMGHTTPAAQQAFLSSPEIRGAAERATAGYIGALSTAAASGGVITGDDYQRLTEPVLQQMRSDVAKISPEHAEAVRTLQLPGFLSSESQSGRVSVAKSATGGVTWGKSGDIVKMLNATNFHDLPVTIVDSNGKPKQMVIPDASSPKSQAVIDRLARPGGALASTNFGSTLPGKRTGIDFVTTPKKTAAPVPVPTDTNGTNRQSRFGTRGMGLMGAGMLAQTGIMGLQMAGKEVPAAAEYATTGLMAVGMAAMSFPNATEKVATKLGAVFSALGPYGIAIGAAVAAIGGTALLWKKFNEDTRQQGIDLGKSLNDTTSSIEEVGTAFNKTGYVQQQVAKEQGTTTEQLTAAQQFLKSDTGQKLLEQYTSESLKIGQNVAGTSLASKLASYVINGVMGTSDVKAFLGALKVDNPAQGAQVERYVNSLMGAKGSKMPGTLANDIYASQSDNTATTLSLMRGQQQQIQETNSSIVDTFMNSDWKTKGLLALQAITNPASIPVNAGAMEIGRQVDVRGSMNRVGGLMASATNTQIQSGLQNRLALEAQLNMLMEERNNLQKQSEEGALAEEDAKRLNYLNKAIPDTRKGIVELGAALQETSLGMNEMFNSAGSDDQKRAVLDSLNTMIQDSKDATAIFMSDMVRNDPNLALQDQFSVMSKLANGALNPAGMQSMLAYGKQGMTGIVNAVNTLPVSKLQSFSLEIGKMTGPQAQMALQNFGKRFVNAATAAKLSGKEAKDAAKALGATPKQQKQVRVAVKMDKIKDLTKGVDRKVTVAASTEGAKKKIDDLRRAAEKATGKKIKINASDNAGQVITRLRKLIKEAENADSTDPNIETSTNAPQTEEEINTLAGTIGEIAGAGLVINATDNATPVANTAADALTTVMGLNPSPNINVTSNAASVASTTTQQLSSIPDEEVVVRVRKEGAVATGGLWNGVSALAVGGIHRGPGKVSGPGGPVDDKVNARLSNGEFVIRASSVQKYGTAFMSAVNSGMYDKNGFAAGTPIKKAPLPPKEGDAKGRQADFAREWRSVLYEAENFMRTFNNMGKIIKAGRNVLTKNFKVFDNEFAQYLADNYSPRQIKKMFAKRKDKGAKKIRKEFEAQKKAEAYTEADSSFLDASALKARADLYQTRGTDRGSQDVIAGMGADQIRMYQQLSKKNKTAYLKNLKVSAQAEKAMQDVQDQRDRKRETEKAYKSATGTDTRAVMAATGIADPAKINRYADALGMSMEDLAQQIKDGSLPQNFEYLAQKAEEAAKAMEVLAMSDTEKQAAKISAIQGQMAAFEDVAGANARKAISEKFGGTSQGVLEAQMAERDAQMSIKQATLDDINYQYERQLDTINQIEQQQQSIAALERGRLSVANALSQGDIAGAAAAAQQQRADTAAAMQQMMRTQLENQQKARNLALETEIRNMSNENRDIQNQIALLTAQANLNQAGSIASLQAQADAVILQPGYIATANAEYQAQLDLLNQSLAVLQAQAALSGVEAAATVTATDPAAVTISGSAKKVKKKKKKAFGGWVPGVGNSDNVPLLATPGEFVMRKAAAARFGPTLQAMNSGTFKGNEMRGGGTSIGSVVFNINGANLDEKAVADIAVRKMRSLDSATIRGGRF